MTLVYRRGAASMSATAMEQEFAKQEWRQRDRVGAAKRRSWRATACWRASSSNTRSSTARGASWAPATGSASPPTVLKAISQTLVVPPDGDGAELLQTRQGTHRRERGVRHLAARRLAGGDCVGG